MELYATSNQTPLKGEKLWGSAHWCKLWNSRYKGELQTTTNENVPTFKRTTIHAIPQILQTRLAHLSKCYLIKKRWKRFQLDRSKFSSAPILSRYFGVLFIWIQEAKQYSFNCRAEVLLLSGRLNTKWSNKNLKVNQKKDTKKLILVRYPKKV